MREVKTRQGHFMAPLCTNVISPDLNCNIKGFTGEIRRKFICFLHISGKLYNQRWNFNYLNIS